MSSSNSSEAPSKSPEKKRRYLSAEKKFQIYLEAQDGRKPVGELLRREGLFSTDLARIRQQVKEGALQRLSAKPGRQQGHVGTEVHEAIKRELQDKERALGCCGLRGTGGCIGSGSWSWGSGNRCRRRGRWGIFWASTL